MTSRKPTTVYEWDYERKRLIKHIKDLLLNPLDPQVRSMALSHLEEVFEDDGLESVKPNIT